MSTTTKTRATLAQTITDDPPMGRLYEADGRSLALCRAGSGGPTVVFLPGAGLIGLDFMNIHEPVSGFATSVIYDRGGTGWSDPVSLPRSAADAAGELRGLLRAAGISPPYILVGHSLGGAYIRRFEQLYPDEVAGLVFLDPAHEGYATLPAQSPVAQLKMGMAMLPALINARGFYGPRFKAMFAAWPEGLRAILVEYHLRAWRKSLQEAANLQTEVLAEIAAGGEAPAAPYIVLTAMGIDPFMAPFMPATYLHDLNERKARFYSAFAAASPLGENRLLPDAGHSTLHTDRPDAVVQAIRDLVGKARA